ncbi:L-2-hydroxyglutarate oxidase [Salidesulfovibrio onnuriiensis]|uniref:L-2-hydroxyglutarate oxidase n=1 Tax=Salidesulfovibrio onnuriiensis TaxID=2583823 RepID=UPI0011CB2A9C|nr:L-2-hydroxyglutarate oxidase [Salidesulfovibrio onnuriiensis]
MTTYDFVICGGGIIGLTVARELVRRGHKNILILDKEPELGKHASGRNSGVLHAGIYYDPGTLKARMCFEGNMLMREYCRERNLPLFESGKVIVARDESELPTLEELERRATANGATVHMIDERQLAELEPNARTTDKALHSPLTAVVDPKAILKSMRIELEDAGVQFEFGTAFLGAGDGFIITSKGDIGYGLFINAAGAHSDKVAHAFGMGRDYMLIPFKGIYKTLKRPAADQIKGSIYPVPNIKNPFLGVHFTRSMHGDVYLGPTAIPAFGRENYGILKGIDSEFLSILLRDAQMFFGNPKFRGVALEEPRKYISRFFYEDARKLVRELDPKDIEHSPKAGIRPQLVNVKTKELVMDFTIERGRTSLHVLNSISPAFTSAMSFARMLADEHMNI